MKLAFSTLGCPDWTLRHAVDRARAFGFGAIEIRGIKDRLRADEIEALRPEARAETLRHAAQSGVAFCCLDTSASFHAAETRAENAEEAFAAVRLAAACGVPFVRVFGDRLAPGGEDRGLAEIAAAIRELCLAARRYPVEILLEVHGDLNTAERILQTAEGVRCDNFGILWDIAHSREEPAAFWQKTGGLIRHVHIKDRTRTGLCNTGEGSLPVASAVRVLERGGYAGYYCLEWEKRWQPALRAPEEEFPAYVRFMNRL